MESDWYELLTGEMLTFGLVAKALYTYPERTWLETLLGGDIFAEAPFAAGNPDVVAALELLRAWSEHNRGGLADEAFDDLRADYTRLFIGPGEMKVAPWESVYFNDERLTFQKETLQVRAWYQRFGLQAERLYNEPDDHVGLELEFIAHLARLGLQALEQKDEATLTRSLKAQRDFVSEHLMRWAPRFCEQTEKETHTDFYRGIARLTRGLLDGATAMLARIPGEG